MKRPDLITKKILTTQEAVQRVRQLKMFKKKVVFTNGVFDILHPGHIFSLSQAAVEGDYLMVAINSDGSVKRLKGDSRPINDQNTRALLLASLQIVDAVIIFEEDTPLELIRKLLPDVMVKGGDYTIDQIAGAKEVIADGGKVLINPILEGHSTTATISRMKQ